MQTMQAEMSECVAEMEPAAQPANGLLVAAVDGAAGETCTEQLSMTGSVSSTASLKVPTQILEETLIDTLIEEETTPRSTPPDTPKSTADRFEAAVEALNAMKTDGKDRAPLSQEDQLYLYSHYKQATIGDCTNSSKPGMFDFVGKAKHNRWATLLGVTQDDAMLKYIERANFFL